MSVTLQVRVKSNSNKGEKLAGIMHQVMGRLSWESLSEKDKKIWDLKPEIPDDSPEFLKSYQPVTVEEKIGWYSLFLDLMGWRTKEIVRRGKFLLDSSHPVPHGLPSATLDAVGTDEKLFDTFAWRTLFRQFIPDLVQNLKQGKNEQAGLLAGLLAHVIQDAASPGHLFPNRLFYDLFPEEDLLHRDYHTLFDQVTPEIKPVSPALLGTSVPEFIFRLAMLGEQNYQKALSLIVPAIHACQSGNRKLLESLCREPLQNAVFQVASLFHTAAALSSKIDPEEKDKLQTFDLTTAVEHYLHPAPKYGSILPRKYNIVHNRFVPLVLDCGKGPQPISSGLGLSSFHSFRYLLEPGAFSFFQGTVGLSARYTEDQQKDMKVEFFICLANDWNRTITSDLQYGPELRKVFSCFLQPGQSGIPFSIELGKAQTLLVAVLPHPEKKKGKEICWYPHVVLAYPRLVKKEKEKH